MSTSSRISAIFEWRRRTSKISVASPLSAFLARSRGRNTPIAQLFPFGPAYRQEPPWADRSVWFKTWVTHFVKNSWLVMLVLLRFNSFTSHGNTNMITKQVLEQVRKLTLPQTLNQPREVGQKNCFFWGQF